MATMNLADPALELVDPTPNVHTLFIHFDKEFFWKVLARRAVVRWSKRMYASAGICTYEGRGGLCDIALSEPLLKLRPRKDLVETLLHEMIHAFLFITNRDQDRDGHGPNFKAHMHRINRRTGLNITIYHDFHDEVLLYQTHWWRCGGPCQSRPPYFGIVRRSMNRPPGPLDYWWDDHKKGCGGVYTKIKEPDNKKKTGKGTENNPKKNGTAKANGTILKYVTNKNNTTNKVPAHKDTRLVLRDSNTNTQRNPSDILVVTKKGVIFNPVPIPLQPTTGYSDDVTEIVINDTECENEAVSANVAHLVRNIWINKQFAAAVKEVTRICNAAGASNKHKVNTEHTQDPPAKIKKVDDNLKANASAMLKDVYGEDFNLTQSENGSKLAAVSLTVGSVECPVCSTKIDNKDINTHLDECLNKQVIQELTKDQNLRERTPATSTIDINTLNQLDGDLPPLPANIGSQHDLPPQVDVVYTLGPNGYVPNNNRQNSSQPKRKVSRKRKNGESQPGPSRINNDEQTCPCCGNVFYNTAEEHLEECLVFFDNDAPIPEEDVNPPQNIPTIVIDDDDDDADDSAAFNSTGTKTPCPCCMRMVEQAAMNAHLDYCLGLV